MPVSEVQRLINSIDNNKTEFTYSPVISEKLREMVKIPEPEKKLADELKNKLDNVDNGLEQTKNELKELKDEFKQQMKIIKELFNFVKNSNNSDWSKVNYFLVTFGNKLVRNY